MINISPLSGYTITTPFSLSASDPSINYTINWGDGIVSDSSTLSHHYTAANIYNVFVSDCATVSSFSLTAYPSNYLLNSIHVSYNILSAYTSCPQTLTLNVTSTNPIATVFLYSSGSLSNPTVDNSFWNQMTPEWGFYDSNNNKISQLDLTCSPIMSSNMILGYTASSTITYTDDMPGKPVLFFSLKQNQENILINSRAYAALTHTVSAIIPNNINITTDGINDLASLQWADHPIPYTLTFNNTNIPCSNMLHYAKGYLTNVNYYTNCNGITSSQYQTSSIPINPYAINTFLLPSSAFPPDQLKVTPVACGENPYLNPEIIKTRKYPNQLVIEAFGVANINGRNYVLSGTSTPFNIYKFENFNDFYRKGEDTNVYDLIKKYSYIDLEQHDMLNTYLSAIGGEGDSLGIVYDRIQNFSKDHNDIDTCTIDSLYDMSQKFSMNIDNFDLQFPEELRRVMNFFSVPLPKLIGTRCKCNNNFADCVNSCNVNVCNACGFDKKSNLGKQIYLTDNVTAGDTILYRERGSSVYNFLPIKVQDKEVYPLGSLSAQQIVNKGIENFCFFEWNQTPQNNPVEGIVNYKDPRNSLSPGLSAYEDWYGDGGVIEESLNYILTKNLLG